MVLSINLKIRNYCECRIYNSRNFNLLLEEYRYRVPALTGYNPYRKSNNRCFRRGFQRQAMLRATPDLKQPIAASCIVTQKEEAERARIRFVSCARLLLPNRRRKAAISRESCGSVKEEEGESRNGSRPCQNARFDPRRRNERLAR